jgi:hypothetical protein
LVMQAVVDFLILFQEGPVDQGEAQSALV